MSKFIPFWTKHSIDYRKAFTKLLGLAELLYGLCIKKKEFSETAGMDMGGRCASPRPQEHPGQDYEQVIEVSCQLGRTLGASHDLDGEW